MCGCGCVYICQQEYLENENLSIAFVLAQGFHSQGIKVIVWATSMVNTDSSNYKEGFEKGYYVKSLFGLVRKREREKKKKQSTSSASARCCRIMKCAFLLRGEKKYFRPA